MQELVQVQELAAVPVLVPVRVLEVVLVLAVVREQVQVGWEVRHLPRAVHSFCCLTPLTLCGLSSPSKLCFSFLLLSLGPRLRFALWLLRLWLLHLDAGSPPPRPFCRLL